MQSNQIPTKFPIVFGSSAGSGQIREIPVNSQIGVADGAASLTDGFPPLCFLPTGSGGIPPFGQDFNGLLRTVTAWCRWQAAGGLATYDSTFSVAIGGYPRGACIVSSVTPGRVWISTADNNTTDPDGNSPAGWLAIALIGDIPAQVIAAGLAPATTGLTFLTSTTFVVPTGVKVIKKIRVWGAGGGGGGSFGPNGGGAGGGAGGYAESINVAVTQGQSIPVTIGNGGAGGNGAPTSGGAGNTSSFGPFCSATGGGGGAQGNNINAFPGGAPGTGTGNALGVSGTGGGNAFLIGGTVASGIGGGCTFGGAPNSLNIASPGNAGSFPGGAGNGGAVGNGGGPGAQGLAYIEY